MDFNENWHQEMMSLVPKEKTSENRFYYVGLLWQKETTAPKSAIIVVQLILLSLYFQL